MRHPDTAHTKAEVCALSNAFGRVQAAAANPSPHRMGRGIKGEVLSSSGDCNRVVGDDAFAPLLALAHLMDTTTATPPTVNPSPHWMGRGIKGEVQLT